MNNRNEEVVLTGEIIEALGEPTHHSYIIEDQDGNRYFAHIGDLSDNQDLLYRKRTGDAINLEEGQRVSFTVNNNANRLPHVFNVRIA